MSFFDSLKTFLTQPIGKPRQPKAKPAEAPPQPTAPPVKPITPGQPQNSVSIDAVMNSVADGIVALDRSGTIRLINAAGARLAGFNNPQDAVGLNFASVLQLTDNSDSPLEDRHNPLIKALKNNETMTTREFRLTNREGQNKTPIELTTAYDMADDAIIVTYRNIAQELKEDSEQMEFISTASHEMRTPIASIEGFIGLALNEKSASIDERARGYLEKAGQASKHLGELFKDLLDATQLADQQLKAHLQPVEMTALVRDTVMQFGPVAVAKGLVVLFNSIPITQAEAAGEQRLKQALYARVDVEFVREIMNNLLENAVKYTPAGRIEVTVQGSTSEVVVSVRDSGMGIGAEDLPHIFQKFYRADNSETRTIGGTGLGLYISRARAEAMDGTLVADSTYGRGSIFFLRLPRMSQEDFEKARALYENQLQMPAPTPAQEAPAIPAAAPAPAPAPEPVAQPIVNGGVNG